jgi:mono/diheme cytochrome c family protein
VAIVGLGVLMAVGLFGLPFFDRGPKRHPLNRPVATVVMILIVVGMVFLTIQAVVTTPPQAEAAATGAGEQARIDAGAKLYKDYCAKCHGDNGEGAELPDQPGTITNPLNDEPFLITHSSDTLFSVINYGWDSLGMPAFGLTNGGQLTDPDIRTIVTFLQSWYTPPAAQTAAGGKEDLSALAKIENPSFAKDVKPILDKKCTSCHGKRTKGGYSVATYDNVLKSGDHAPVITPGDAANSTLAKMLHGVKTDAGGQMPPSRPLAKEQIDLIERWINQGAQNN